METKLSVRKISEMREVTMSSEALAKEDDGSVVEDTYYMIRRPGMNLTILPEYRLGREYPKTYGHFHEPESEETYEVLLGEAAILIQRGTDPVEEIKLIKLKKGDSFTVPKGYAHSLINLGEGPVVTLDDYDPAEFRNNYDPIREKRGFAHYLLEEDKELKATPNSNYAEVPSLKIS